MAYDFAVQNQINLEKIMLRGNNERINIYDLYYHQKKPRVKDFVPINDFFKIRSTNHYSSSQNQVDISQEIIPQSQSQNSNYQNLEINLSQTLNPKYEVPQIQLTRKIYINEIEKILQAINKDSENQFELEDLILKASCQTCYDLPQFRQVFVNGKLYQTENFLLAYKNLEDDKKNRNIWLDKSQSLRYFQKQNIDIIMNPFFLIEDSGNLPLTRIQPILYYQNVIQKEQCIRYKLRIA